MIKRQATSSLIAGIVLSILAACGGTPPKPLPEPLQSAKHHEHRAGLNYQHGRYAPAIRQYQLALDLYRSIDDLEQQVRTQINLIETALLINRLDFVKAQLVPLSELIKFSELKMAMPRWQLLHCRYLLKIEQTEQALTELEKLSQDEAITRQANLRQTVAVDMAVAAAHLSHPNADKYLHQAELEVGNQASLKARLLRIRASLAAKSDDFVNAELSYNRALQYYRDALFKPGIAATLAELGKLYLNQEKPVQARHFFDRALAVRLQLSDYHQSGILLTRLEQLEVSLGNTEAAAAYQRQRLHLTNAISDR